MRVSYLRIVQTGFNFWIRSGLATSFVDTEPALLFFLLGNFCLLFQMVFIIIIVSNDVVKTRILEPTMLQVSLTRFFFIGNIVGNEAARYLKLVLVLFRAC